MKKIFIILILLLSFNNIYSQCYIPTTCAINSKIDSTRHSLLKNFYLQIGVEKIPDFYNLYDPLRTYVIPKPIPTSEDIRQLLLDILDTQLGIREVPEGSNRGKMIDIYNKHVGNSLGDPYCAAFVSYNLDSVGVDNPRSGWSPYYAKKKDIIYKAKNTNNEPLKAGDVVTYYYSNLGRVGHTGFYLNTDINGYIITEEANTNSSSSVGTIERDGSGVYKKKRELSKVYAITRYIRD
ncbi:CHAP domain-containing protein [Candidatus Dojkabacteria bacterium]|jgi:hypothetical protein|nr:CHAP domain-containing protein [Candidatus Dojkabacteria bacterium]